MGKIHKSHPPRSTPSSSTLQIAWELVTSSSKTTAEETESNSWQHVPLPKRPISPYISWLSPVEANLTSPIYTSPRSGLHVWYYLCTKWQRGTRWTKLPSAWSSASFLLKRALFGTWERCLCSDMGALCSNVAIPVLLRKEQKTIYTDLQLAQQSFMAYHYILSPHPFTWLRLSLACCNCIYKNKTKQKTPGV